MREADHLVGAILRIPEETVEQMHLENDLIALLSPADGPADTVCLLWNWIGCRCNVGEDTGP